MQSQSQSSNLPNSAAAAPENRSSADNSLLATYQPVQGIYDEAVDSQGGIRSGWQLLLDHIARSNAQSFAYRWEQSQRLIYENGIAYSPYTDSADAARPWQLDALPVPLSEDEWNPIGEGLKQRAMLLNRVLADLYGPQDLIRTGVLPAELLHDHPGFQLPFHRQEQVEDDFLQFYAADLGRSPNGQWWVLADRTESPSGVGFALENRVVISRMLPEGYRLCKVRRLASYFMTLRKTLRRLARTHRENPRIVILTQGPKNANYFEDAYLARYLGFTLVEGSDLAVRHNRVWLKTLVGLLQVDVIIRRPNSLDCDPLEVPGDSSSGVAGLLQAAREGHVVITNPLGSGLVESPAFMAFMPRLCKAIFDQELKLPGIASWWCGESKSLDYVLSHLGRLVVKRAFRQRGSERKATLELNSMTTDELMARIRQNPNHYVAQETVRRSTVPQWNNGDMQSAHLSMRAFLVASDESFEVMPGGLARTSMQSESLESSLLTGEGSKDAWVTSDKVGEVVSLLPSRDAPIQLLRSGAELPSRVAENIFWLGRHLERVDASARILRTIADRITSEREEGSLTELPLLLRVLAEQGQIEPGFVVEGIRERLPTIENALPDIVFDQQQSNSLRSAVHELLRIAQSVRDRLSTDSWRVLVRIDQRFRKPDSDSIDLTNVLNLTNDLIIDLSAISGVVTESMTRSFAYRFLDLGRRLERAAQIVLLLRNCFVDNRLVTRELLEVILELSNSLMTYRSRYLADLRLTAVLDILITDETNPRSIAYQLAQISSSINELPRDRKMRSFEEDQRLALILQNSVQTFEIEKVTQVIHLIKDESLDLLLTQLDEQLPMLSNALSHKYMVHAGPNKQLARVIPDLQY